MLDSLFAPRLPRWFWPLLLGLNFALHAPFFARPPFGMHVWRQCNTMAVARNLFEEGLDPLHPRVDRRNDTDGVTGMQFPSFEWVVAGAYRTFGFHESLPRLLNWLFYMAAAWAFYALVRRISGRAWLGAVAAWSLAWSPELFYHGINALPDVLALAASLAGLHWFVAWHGTRRPLLLLLSVVATALGGLTKLQYLVVGVPMAVLVLRDLLARRLSGRDVALLAAYAALAVGLPLAWYAHALRLIARSGLADFGLEIRSETDPATAWGIIAHNLISDWPEMLLGYGSLVLFGLGLWRLGGWARAARPGPGAARAAAAPPPWLGPGAAWAAALAIYYFLELRQMKHHLYYQLPLLPVLLLLGVWAAAWLARHPRGRPVLLALLLVQPAWATLRVSVNRWLRGGPAVAPELYAPASRAALEAATPPGARCLVGPDDSGCINFYFLHKKGFGFERPEQLAEPGPDGRPYIAACVARGAAFLYTNDSAATSSPVVRPFLGREVARVGQFRVWALRRP